MPLDLHPRLAATAAQQGGVFTATQAQECGYDAAEIRRLVTCGRWRAVRRGVYCQQARYEPLDQRMRHLVAVHALLLTLRAPAWVSHESAALLHGLELLQPDLGWLHVSRADVRHSRREAGVHHHAGALLPGHVTTVDGAPVTSLDRTAVDLARRLPFRHGVVAADAALHKGATPAELGAVLTACSRWSGAREAARVIAFADGRSESVGESVARVVMAEQGIPPPDLQRRLDNDRGFVARVDFLWDEFWTVHEFDGRVKYRVPPGATREEASEVVWREKRREDDIRELGYEVVRSTWADLYRPEILAGRLRRAFARGTTRHARHLAGNTVVDTEAITARR